MRVTTLGSGVTTLGVDAIFGSGSASLGSQKETLRFTVRYGGDSGSGAGIGG